MYPSDRKGSKVKRYAILARTTDGRIFGVSVRPTKGSFSPVTGGPRLDVSLCDVAKSAPAFSVKSGVAKKKIDVDKYGNRTETYVECGKRNFHAYYDTDTGKVQSIKTVGGNGKKHYQKTFVFDETQIGYLLDVMTDSGLLSSRLFYDARFNKMRIKGNQIRSLLQTYNEARKTGSVTPELNGEIKQEALKFILERIEFEFFVDGAAHKVDNVSQLKRIRERKAAKIGCRPDQIRFFIARIDSKKCPVEFDIAHIKAKKYAVSKLISAGAKTKWAKDKNNLPVLANIGKNDPHRRKIEQRAGVKRNREIKVRRFFSQQNGVPFKLKHKKC